MRVIVSALTEHPLVWTITKIENISPLGIQKITLYQNIWNDNTDYVNLETGEMYANYYDFEVAPSDKSEILIGSQKKNAIITVSTPILKIGGSYKTLTVNLNDEEDILSKYPNAEFNWTCSIDEKDWTNNVTWRNCSLKNQIKLKFSSDRNQLGKLLNVNCKITENKATLYSALLQLELSE